MKKNSPLLVLDAHYLCHRAFHSQRGLTWDGVPTGVLYGFLKGIIHLKELFLTDRVAFCFEGHNVLRKVEFKDYKAKRSLGHGEDPEKIEARKELHTQVNKLREVYLHEIGFRNIFFHPSYESDDIMAQLATRDDDVILVTSDADMYQCLRPNVRMWDPNKQKLFTEKWFTEEYKIKPRQWAVMKAIAGCSTDGVPGIYGVGETTALRFIRGELAEDSKQWNSIMCGAGRMIVNRNRRLVELPYLGAPKPELEEDEVTIKGWNTVCKRLGFRSLMNRPPIYQNKLL